MYISEKICTLDCSNFKEKIISINLCSKAFSFVILQCTSKGKIFKPAKWHFEKLHRDKGISPFNVCILFFIKTFWGKLFFQACYLLLLLISSLGIPRGPKWQQIERNGSYARELTVRRKCKRWLKRQVEEMHRESVCRQT